MTRRATHCGTLCPLRCGVHRRSFTLFGPLLCKRFTHQQQQISMDARGVRGGACLYGGAGERRYETRRRGCRKGVACSCAGPSPLRRTERRAGSEVALHACRPLKPSKLLHRRTSASQVVVSNASGRQSSPITRHPPPLHKDERRTCTEDSLPPPGGKKRRPQKRHRTRTPSVRPRRS